MNQTNGRGQDQGIQVIARATQILRVLRDDTSGLSLGQIAERVGLPRSTVQRIVNSLLAERLVIAASGGGGLRLGPEIQSLAASSRIDIVEQLHPTLLELSRKTGETVDLSVLRDGQMIFLDQVIGSHRLRTVSSVGESFPLTTTANGKSALSVLDEKRAIQLVEDEVRMTGKDLDTRAFFDALTDCRKAGYSEDSDEHTEGISAVGKAFTDAHNAIYAISIPVPSSRFVRKRESLIEALLTTVAGLNLAG